MRILLDHCVPRQLKRAIEEDGRHETTTAKEAGLKQVRNGQLLNEADAAGYDTFVTADKSIRHQQNLQNRRFGTVVLPSPNWPVVKPVLSEIVDAIERTAPGRLTEIPVPAKRTSERNAGADEPEPGEPNRKPPS